MKQTQFIAFMSDSLGVEQKTIRMIVRTLREEGLFTTGARGVNAPDMTPLDAARVVIAVLSSPSPSRAARDVKYFGPMKVDMRGGDSAQPIPSWFDANKTLEEVVLDCLSNELPYEQLIGGEVHLSEIGNAHISFRDFWPSFHHREQWQAIMDDPKNKDARDNFNALSRVFETKVNRSASFALEHLLEIGFELIGWEVD